MRALVLVVDDDVDIRDSLLEMLEEHGYAAVGAGNGVEALEVLRTSPRPPSLILLDLMMPVMDGRGFREAQLERAAWSAIPVIVVSAYGDVEVQARALGLDYLRKPLAIRPVIDVVHRYCGPPSPT